MNRDKVLELAQQAELDRQLSMEVPFVVDRLERFAALVEAEVRGDAEPVAYETDQELWAADAPDINNWIRKNGRPLYRHPTPAVVRQLVEALGKSAKYLGGDTTRNNETDKEALAEIHSALAAAKEVGL